MSAPAEPLLSLRGLRAGYGAIEVLRGVDLEVRAGEIVTLLGANGAGKSTVLSCISGVLPVRAGELSFAGVPYRGRPAHEIVRMGICQVPEGRRIFPRMTVRENLRLGAFEASEARRREDLERLFALFPVLRERERQLGGTLSGGEQQMLAIARGLMGRPKLLLLDEPSLGLSPLFVQKVARTLSEIRRQGVTVLLVEQNAHLALEIADRAYVLETGTIALSGEAARLREDPRVREAYLGG